MGVRVCWNSVNVHLQCGNLPGVSLPHQQSWAVGTWEGPAIRVGGLKFLLKWRGLWSFPPTTPSVTGSPIAHPFLPFWAFA